MHDLGAIPRTSREPAVNDDLGLMRRLAERCPRCDCRYPFHINAGPTPEPKTLIFLARAPDKNRFTASRTGETVYYGAVFRGQKGNSD